jgi:hypothetical protein
MYFLSDKYNFAAIVGPGGQRRRGFSGIAYTGGVVNNHWYYGTLIIDLDGVTFSPENMPILKDHDQQKILGYATKLSKENGVISIDGVFLDSSPEAQKVIEMADEGFPWQLSISIDLEQSESIPRGASALVNGQEIHGPLTAIRKAQIREVSFCAVGAVIGTTAAVFSNGPYQGLNYRENIPAKEGKIMPSSELAPKVNKGEPENKPGILDRDLALSTLSDEKKGLAEKNAKLEMERAGAISEAAELRALNKSLEFELSTLKDSLSKSQAEIQALREEKLKFTKETRTAVLAEDYKRLGVSFSASDESIAAVLAADETVFVAFRKTLGAINRVPAAPPKGAFESLTPPSPELDGPANFSLTDMAKARREQTNREVN